MEKQKDVSIILIDRDIYERPDELVRSIVNQSVDSIELVHVYSDSNSALSKAVDAIGNDTRIIRIKTDRTDLNHMCQLGLEGSSGEYIFFALQDGIILDYALEAILNKFKRYEADVIRYSVIPFSIQKQNYIKCGELSLKYIPAGYFNTCLEGTLPDLELNVLPALSSLVIRRKYLESENISFSDTEGDFSETFYYRVLVNTERLVLTRDMLMTRKYDESSHGRYENTEEAHDHICQLNDLSEILGDDAYKIINKIILRILKTLEYSINLTSSDEIRESAYQLLDFIVNDDYRYVQSYEKRILTLLKAVDDNESIPVGEAVFAVDDMFMKEAGNPLVSVVVPTYNQEEYLNEALNSLCSQTLKRIEIICVNDGSTDKTMAIMKEYAAIDKRIRIIDKENSGYGISMNIGIDAAKGKYLGILEPDDYVSLSMYKDLVLIADKYHLDLIKADFNRFRIGEDRKQNNTYVNVCTNRDYYDKVIDTSNDIETFKFVMNTWSGIYRLSFINKWKIRHNETPGASYQDNGFWFKTFCRAKRAWFVQRAYYMNRRDNPNSSMFDQRKVYAIKNEYDYIYKWLEQDKALLDKYYGIFLRKKFDNYVMTYNRIAPQYKEEFLTHLREEFQPLVDQNTINEELIGTGAWKLLQDYLNVDEEYDKKICVSVIIPAYNVEKYIGQCLDSILAREEIGMEVICVDDGSTDNTLNILKDYEARDHRVKVISQTNAGAGAARNNGMKYARGEYLSFLDADDFFEPNMLGLAYRTAHNNESDIIVFDSDNYIEEKKAFEKTSSTIRRDLLPLVQPFSGNDVRHEVFRVFVGWAWDKLFLRSFVEENHLQFQEQRTTNDMLFVFSAVVRAERINTLGTILAHHRRLNAGESLSVSREKSWDCFYHALCALKKQLIEWNVYERFERDFINYALHFSLWNVNTIKGNAYQLLYGKLKNEWFDEFNISDKKPKYFYNTVEYEQYTKILELDPEDYLIWRMNETNLQTISRLNGTISQKNNIIAARDRELNDIKTSVTFRTALIVTGIPRKIKHMIRDSK